MCNTCQFRIAYILQKSTVFLWSWMIYIFFCLLYTACIFLRYADFILVLLIRRTKQKDNCPRSCSEHTVSLRTTVSKFIAAMGCLAMLSQITCLTYSCSAVCPLLSLLTPAIFPSPLKCKRTKSCLLSLCFSSVCPFQSRTPPGSELHCNEGSKLRLCELLRSVSEASQSLSLTGETQEACLFLPFSTSLFFRLVSQYSSLFCSPSVIGM